MKPNLFIRRIILVIGFTAMGNGVLAETKEEVLVVSASRIAETERNLTVASTVLNEKLITNRNSHFASDLLRLAPGLTVSNNGGLGKFTQVRMRGAEGNHVMVLIDGMEMNDVALSDEFDFGHMPSSNISQIEVTRGPHSALWGSDAVAGVINIVTKKPKYGKHAKVSADAGTHGLDHQNIELSSRNDLHSFRLVLDRINLGGINTALQGNEEDGYESELIDAKADFKINESNTVEFFTRYQESVTETDTGSPLSDIDNKQKARRAYTSIKLDNHLFDKTLNNTLRINWTSTNSNNKDVNGDSIDKVAADKYLLSFQSNLKFQTQKFIDIKHAFTFAVDREHQRFRQRGTSDFGDPNQDQFINNTGIVGEYGAKIEKNLYLSGAVRRDINSNYNDITTFKVGTAYEIYPIKTLVRLNYATAQKSPNFTERFGFFNASSGGTFVGNQNLSPEKSTGWQIGLERTFLENMLDVKLTYFNEKLENEIDGFVGIGGGLFTADNIDGTSRREGFEAEFGLILPHGFNIYSSYTYIDSTELNQNAGRRLDEVRRPNQQASIFANWTSRDQRLSLSSSVSYSGSFFDNDFSTFPSVRENMEAYTLVGINGSYLITDKLKAFLKIENLLDEKYEELFAVRTYGTSGFFGFELSFGK